MARASSVKLLLHESEDKDRDQINQKRQSIKA